MSQLAEAADDLVTYLEFNLDGAVRSTELEGIAAAADAATTYFQGVGICELLLDSETDAFFHCMIRSGRMRRWLLRQAAHLMPQRGQGYPARILKSSNTRGLFGALLAADWGLAADIAALSDSTWNERVEYRDDFEYARFLHRYIAGDAPPVLASLLDAYTESLEGDEPPPRHRLCAVLLAPFEQRLELASAAFDGLITARRDEMREIAETSIRATDELFVPFSSVFVEGLAWLQILERTGVSIPGELPFCPGLVRTARFAPIPAGTFPP